MSLPTLASALKITSKLSFRRYVLFLAKKRIKPLTANSSSAVSGIWLNTDTQGMWGKKIGK